MQYIYYIYIYYIYYIYTAYKGWSKKSPLFSFSYQSCVLHFFSIFFRWCRQQAWEILLTPIWIQLDIFLRSSQ